MRDAAPPVLAITGGTGFVGSTLLRHATLRQHPVRALTRRPQPATSGVDWIAGSLGDRAALDTLVTGADAVIHVAGAVTAPDAAGFETANVHGTLAIVEAAKAAGVKRFINISSLAAREPGLSLYGGSKAKAEAIVAASGLDWTTVRPPAVFGPGDREMLDLFRLARLGVLLLPPGGRLSVIEVSDLSRLLLALVPAHETVGATYEVDDGVADGWTHIGFAQAIGAAVGHKRIATISAPRGVLRAASAIDRMLRGRKAKLTRDRVAYFSHPDWVSDPALRPPTELWNPHIDTRAGLVATANSHRAAGWL